MNKRKTPRRRGKGRSKEAEPNTTIQEPMRLNRYLARSGVCSRRDADTLIADGKVKVNGQLVSEMGTRVEPGDVVVVNGKSVTPQPHVYILLNKPTDTITTVEDDRGRPTVMDLVKDSDEKATDERIFPVGRLDRDTSGVLLLTNDGELAHRLMHPSYEIEKLYRVETLEPVKTSELEKLTTGMELEDGTAVADQAAYVALPDRRIIGVSLHMGKNRQIRRMFEALGHSIRKLERVAYAGLTVEGLRRGKWRRLTQIEVTRLRRKVKLR